MAEQTTSDGERLIKLALFVKERGPVDFATIRARMHEYAQLDTASADEQRKRDEAVRRKFERDKKALAECGLFIHSDERSLYTLDMQASFAAPVDLTESQASLLRLLCAALLEDPSYPLKNELRMIVAKISDELEVPDLLPESTAGSMQGREPSGLKKIQKAISQRKRLRFDYTNAAGVASTREVEPFGCFFLNKQCYVAAVDPKDALAESAAPDRASGRARYPGERLFRLDRMGHMKVNAAKPNEPDFEEREFDAAHYYGLPFQFGRESVDAQVRFNAANAWRAERLSMGQGTFEELPAEDDADEPALLWTVNASNLRDLAAWCIENGPGVLPIEPAAAQVYYREMLTAAVAAHKPSREGGCA